MATITIPSKIEKELKYVSQETGFSKEELLIKLKEFERKKVILL